MAVGRPVDRLRHLSRIVNPGYVACHVAFFYLLCCRIWLYGIKHAAYGGVDMAESVVLVRCPLVPIPLAARGLAAVLARAGPAGALVADAAPAEACDPLHTEYMMLDGVTKISALFA